MSLSSPVRRFGKENVGNRSTDQAFARIFHSRFSRNFRISGTHKASSNGVHDAPYVVVPTHREAAPAFGSDLPTSWCTVAVVFGLTLSTLAGSFIVSVLYIRPVLKAAEKAAQSVEIGVENMNIAAQEMEKTAVLMQQDIPVTMAEIQVAAQEFESLAKQLNEITTTVLKPVVQPVEALGAAGAAAGKTARRVVDESSTLASSLRATLSSFRKYMGWQELSEKERSEADRLIGVSRRQQEARLWITRWRQKGRRDGTMLPHGNEKDEEERMASAFRGGRDASADYHFLNLEGVAEIGQVLKKAIGSRNETDKMIEGEQDAAAEVLAALEKAQVAAEEAARASGMLEVALQRAERKGVLRNGSSESDED